MFHSREVMQLEEGERLVAVVRRHAATLLPGLCLAALLIALPFFFLFPLLGLGFVGAVIISLCLAVGVYLALKTFLLWNATALVVSDRRIVCVRQSGIWRRAVTEWPLLGLTLTVERRGMRDALLRTGCLRLQGAGGASPVVFVGLGSPERVASIVMTLRDARNAGFRLKEI